MAQVIVATKLHLTGSRRDLHLIDSLLHLPGIKYFGVSFSFFSDFLFFSGVFLALNWQCRQNESLVLVQVTSCLTIQTRHEVCEA